MRKTIIGTLVAVLAMFSSQVVAGQTREQQKPSTAQCTRVFEEDGTSRAVVGGAVGAGVGAVAGRMFSKKGTMMGSLLGAGAGALIGHGTREKVYDCKLSFNKDNSTEIVTIRSNKEVTVFDRLNVIRENGKIVDVLQ